MSVNGSARMCMRMCGHMSLHVWNPEDVVRDLRAGVIGVCGMCGYNAGDADKC